jgi:hypothetical protein
MYLQIEKKCPLVVEDEAAKTTLVTPIAGKQLAADVEKKSVLMKRTVTRSESDDDEEADDKDEVAREMLMVFVINGMIRERMQVTRRK